MKYINATNPFGVRQAELQESYFFACKCTKCAQGPVLPQDVFLRSSSQLSPDFSRLAEGLAKKHENKLSKLTFPSSGGDPAAQLRAAAPEAEAFSISDDKSSSTTQIAGALRMCISSGLWSWTRQPVPYLCRSLFGAYIASGNPYAASSPPRY
jgi:hypothetical protein